jgi:hypothetical protein
MLFDLEVLVNMICSAFVQLEQFVMLFNYSINQLVSFENVT